MIYGPYTEKGAKFYYQVYVDALVIGSTHPEIAKKYMAFFKTYIK